DGIRVFHVTGVQTCALPIWPMLTWKPACSSRRVPRASQRYSARANLVADRDRCRPPASDRPRTRVPGKPPCGASHPSGRGVPPRDRKRVVEGKGGKVGGQGG